MTLNSVPLVAALLPAVTVHLCYALAAHLGHVPWCNPYVDGCVSISAAGRHSPEVYIFRAAMIATAVVMMLYWRLGRQWLALLGGGRPAGGRAMVWLGVAAALGLVLYATMLGSIGAEYRLQRRIGVTVFYGFTFLAQLLMTVAMARIAAARPGAEWARTVRWAQAVCALFAAGGLLSLILWAGWDGYRRVEDAFEWSLTALLLLHFVVIHFGWRRSGFEARFAVSAC